MKHSICPSAAGLLLVAWTCLSGVMVLSGAAAETPPILTPHFVRDVRPILSNRCFKCHGPDEEHREAGLRFDQRESATSALDSGLRAIVPAHPDDSQLIARITSTDPDLVMPPPSTMTTLSVEEKNTLAAWIAAGADYQPHWAFVKPLRPAIPTVQQTDWPKNEIDQFILARLEKENLAPSPAADKAALCRRVHLDLIGLPPTPAQLDAFLADTAVDAYEQLVDALLASPRYGERWARRWLDLARYADTNGYEKDRERTIWMYRDWVIRAINDGMPLDQFTTRQLAGDLLPNATTDDIIATGFHRNTMINEEGGIDPLEFRYLAMVDRVGTTATAWLGLTVGCAQCHTHKFDPIMHSDYFSFMALLNNIDEPEWIIPSVERSKQIAETREKIEHLWQSMPDKWPLPVPQPALDTDSTADPTAAAISATAQRSVAVAARFDEWNRQESSRAVHWQIVSPTAMVSNAPHLVCRTDGSILASGDTTKSDVYTLTLPPSDQPMRALRLEVLPDESLPGGGPGLCWYEGEKGDFFLSELEVSTAASGGAAGQRVAIVKATESFAQENNRAAAVVDGNMSSGWSTNGAMGRAHAATFQFAEPVAPGTPLSITMRFERYFACSLGCFRWSVSQATDVEARGHTADEEAILAAPVAARCAAQQQSILRRFLATAPELADSYKQIRQLEDGLHHGLSSLVLRERPVDNPRTTHRHHRGEYLQPKEEVPAAVPAFLPPLATGVPANRLALAHWLVSADNPLTARVTANRQWQAFFGRGIVTSLDDFGYQSAPPSHPELLDWLATELLRMQWSTKSLHRLMVTSATYQQASSVSPALVARDRENVLLARGPRVRLEAEVIRDSLLQAAGLLSTKMYGPGVRPPQPVGVTEVVYGSAKWTASTGEDRYRRSVYTFQKRTAPFAMTTTFDGPTGESCLPKREVSNSPLQALTLLNDPMFVEVAQALSRAAIAAGGDDASRLREIARRVLSRAFNADETKALTAFVKLQRERLTAGDLDAAKLAGEGQGDPLERATWMLVARAVMNLDEAVVKR